MNETPKEKSILKTAIILVVLGVFALAVIFTLLAFIGDDVPTELAPATQTSPGN